MKQRIVIFLLLFALAACGDDESTADAGSDAGDVTQSDSSGSSVCDYSEARCTSLGTSSGPGRLNEHSTVYDEDNLQMIVFGGNTGIPEGSATHAPSLYVGDTWIFDDPCGRWIEVEGDGPSARGQHMATIGGGAMWVFGGRFREDGTGGDYELLNDLWRFDTATRTWEEVATRGTSPPARVRGALVWEPPREQLWLIGGNLSPNHSYHDPVMDLWIFDVEDSRWSEHETVARGPAARLAFASFYDTARDDIVIFGGSDESAFDFDAQFWFDVWILDYVDRQWSQLDMGLRDHPEGRFSPGMVHDVERDLYVLFGGYGDQDLGNLNDVWEWDPTVNDYHWERRSTGDTYNASSSEGAADFATIDPSSPERRNSHGMVWSETCGHALIFGGETDCGSVDDVWQWADGVWTERVAATEGEACHRSNATPTDCANQCF